MKPTENPKHGRLTRTAARMSCALFIVTWVFAAASLLPGLQSAAFVGLVAPLPGLLFGAVALLGALRAQRKDILIAFAGLAVNGLCFLVFFAELPSGPSREVSRRWACIANLKQLHGAKVVWALEQHKTTNDVPADTDLVGTNAYIRSKPECPSDGVYRIGRVGEPPVCSIPGHTL